jgi:SNF2 family DNA or RNA helicase
MAARTLGNSGQRHLTLEDRVNIAEGEDSLTSDDDLDMIPKSKRAGKGAAQDVSFDEYMDELGLSKRDAVEISSDDGEGVSSDRKPKVRGERVAFTDGEDSDDAFKKFQQRKTVKRKQEAAQRAKTKKRANKNTMVGKLPKTVLEAKKRKEKHYDDPSDDDGALMESTLPEYVRSRRSAWDLKRQKLGDAGLQFPPDYEDVDFSDDECLESLQERPAISEFMQPRAPYEDIDLPASCGIIPAPIAQFLRPYQVEGVEFLHELFVYQRGGILGDDMGLGKTIQVIAFLTAVFGKTGDERDWKRMRKMRRKHGDKWYPRVLLVVPGTLVANWKNELEKWGWWHIDTCHGGKKFLEPAVDSAKSGRSEIVITTYDTYRIHSDLINTVRWDCVIADECHRIKERTSETTKTMNDINALCRIGLTGTAIQNKYEELWTLLNWTNPGAFGPLSSWKSTVAVPLKLGQSHDATYAQLKKSREVAQKLVNNLLPRFLLRRPKSLIADQLPKKSDKVVFCPLSEAQELAYNNFCDSEIVQSIRHAYDPCGCGSGKKQGWCCNTHPDGSKWQHFVFPALSTFQKIANHLTLLLPHSPDGGEKHHKELEKLKMAVPDDWEDLYNNRENIVYNTNPQFCGKWRILRKLLKLWHENGDKVLIFSYSVRLLNMLDMLFKTTTTYNVSSLSGKTPNDERQVCQSGTISCDYLYTTRCTILT